MTSIEQAIAELTAKRCSAQSIVDACDAALTGLRLLCEPPVARQKKTRRPRIVKREQPLKARVLASPRRDAILAIVKDHPATFSELARKVPSSKGRTAEQHVMDVRNSLQALKVAGLIAREGQNWVARKVAA